MKFSACLTAVAAACTLAVSAQAQTVSRLYSLGDSLSDAGTYAPTTQLGVAGSGRFTTNPGLIWTQYLAQSLGLKSDPAVTNQLGQASRTAMGGTNYAQGGSRVSLPNVGAYPWVTQDPVSMQVDALLLDTGGRIDSKAVVTVWAGANDIFVAFGSVAGQTLAPNTALANVAAAGVELAAQVRRLQAAGAKYIIINTLPDMGATPLGAYMETQSAGLQALLTGMSTVFNNQLLANTAGSNVFVFDTNKLLNDVKLRPVAYGLTSPTALILPVCAGSSLTCVNPAGAETSLFADDVHPTSAAHRIIAQGTLATLQAAGQVASLATAPLQALRQQSQVLEPRLSALAIGAEATGTGSPRAVGNVQVYGEAQSGTVKASTAGVQLGSELTARGASLGGDIKLLPNALLGVLLSQSSGTTDFSSASGGFKSSANNISVYGSMALTPQWYVNAAISQGDVDYENIHRDVRLGLTSLLVSSTGATSGRHQSVRVGGGYLVKGEKFSGGPTVSLTQESLKVDGYTEAAGPLAMSYGDVEYKAKRLSMGFDAKFDAAGSITPFVRVSLEHDLSKDAVNVSMGSYSTHRMTVETDRPDRTYGLATFGLTGKLTGAMSWSAAVSTTLSQDKGSSTGLSAGLQIPF